MIEIDSIATVDVDGKLITGRVYHVRDNGWPCVKSDAGHVASGPLIEHTEQELAGFLAGYIECALWSTSIEQDGIDALRALDSPDYPAELLDRLAPDCGMDRAELDAGDVAPESFNSMRAECADFLRSNLADLRAYVEACESGERMSYDPSQGEPLSYAGHDFWLTRNGHGAGFWDRGLGKLGDRLSEASKPYGEVYLYVGDDGKVYA